MVKVDALYFHFVCLPMGRERRKVDKETGSRLSCLIALSSAKVKMTMTKEKKSKYNYVTRLITQPWQRDDFRNTRGPQSYLQCAADNGEGQMSGGAARRCDCHLRSSHANRFNPFGESALNFKGHTIFFFGILILINMKQFEKEFVSFHILSF